MVKNTVVPATISVLAVVPRAPRPNSLSSIGAPFTSAYAGAARPKQKAGAWAPAFEFRILC
jgi:hypothetical protein